MSKTPEAWNSPLLDAILAQITPKQQEKVAIKLRVATRIGNLLDERGLQKKQLAEQCELKGASMVTKWLSGGHNFTLDTLVDIAAVLGVSVADLVRPMENRVVFSKTVNVIVAAQVTVPREANLAGGELVSRSRAMGTTNTASEPIFLYGTPQHCYA
jgi:transcriptional regulator with XRE-family HTH domain